MGNYAFGVDIGGTMIRLGLFEEDGSLVDKWEIPTELSYEGSRILPDIAGSIREEMKERAIRQEEVVGVGVGAPGPIDADGTVFCAVNLGWDVFNIPEVLGSYLNLPVKAANDANVAAFGEMWRGGGRGYSDVVAVTLSTGVGGGILTGGRILTGAAGAGGEFGHMRIRDGETESCGCGRTGCLEQYTSVGGILRLARKRLQKDAVPSLLRHKDFQAIDVFKAAEAQDAVAIEVARQFGEYLGKGLAAVASVVNPELIIIGGEVSRAGEVLLEYICPAFEKYVFSACRNVHFVMATLGSDAGIYGAAGLFLNQEERNH